MASMDSIIDQVSVIKRIRPSTRKRETLTSSSTYIVKEMMKL